MTITRYGKCAICRKPTKQTKEFLETVDLFNPTNKPVIRGELSKEIKAWRNTPMHCEEHYERWATIRIYSILEDRKYRKWYTVNNKHRLSKYDTDC